VIKRELKRSPIYECRCDERLANGEGDGFFLIICGVVRSNTENVCVLCVFVCVLGVCIIFSVLRFVVFKRMVKDCEPV
jgi:hypothetical protein